MNKPIKIFIFLFLIGLPLVYSAAPGLQQFTGSYGLEIVYPQYEYVAQGSSFELHVHVYNLSNGVQINNLTAGCDLAIHNKTGGTVVYFENVREGNNDEFIFNLDNNNFSIEGIHDYLIHCNSSEGYGGFVSGTFMVSEKGSAPEQISLSVVLFICIFSILFILIGLYIVFKWGKGNAEH